MTLKIGRLALFCVVLLAALSPSSTAGSSEVDRLLTALRQALGDKDYDAAIRSGERAVELDAKSPDVLLWLGRAYGLKAQNASILTKLSWAGKCRKTWEKAVELDPGYLDARYDLVDFYLMAPGIAGGGIDKAKAQVAEIGKRDPVRGHLAAAKIARSGKDPKREEAECRAAIAADPARKDGLLALSNYLLGAKRYGEARDVWTGWLATDAMRAFAQYQVGRIDFFAGEKLEDAVTLFKAYLTVTPQPDAPTWADASWRLGLVYEKLGRKDDAKVALREALKLDPKHPGAASDLKRIEQG